MSKPPSSKKPSSTSKTGKIVSNKRQNQYLPGLQVKSTPRSKKTRRIGGQISSDKAE
jgi:hypothetical protein